MAEKDKMPVERLFKELETLGEEDANAICRSLLKSDEDLSLKTQIKNPLALTQMGSLIGIADLIGFKNPSATLKGFLKDYRENMCSKDGWRSNQVVDILKSYFASLRFEEEETRADRFLGRSRR